MVLKCSRCGKFIGKRDGDCKCREGEIRFPATLVTELLNSRENARIECAACGEDLYGKKVDAYKHGHGWKVPTLDDKWWLSLHCDDCGYDTSFTSLGIDRR